MARTWIRACVPGEAARGHAGGRSGECGPRARPGRTASAAWGLALGWVAKETCDGSAVLPAAYKRGPLPLELELLELLGQEVNGLVRT